MTNQTSDFDRAILAIEGLGRADLVKLQGVIDTLLNKQCFDTDPVGYVEYKFITRPNGKQYGPYRYRRAWIGGKLRSVYEGKAANLRHTPYKGRQQQVLTAGQGQRIKRE